MELGMKLVQEIVVSNEMTAMAFRSGQLPVYATPSMIAFMENTSARCVENALEEGQSTVGTLVNVRHTAATPVGMRVRCEVELVEIDRRRLVFDVRTFDEAGLIGEGRHERFIIERERFMQKAEGRAHT